MRRSILFYFFLNELLYVRFLRISSVTGLKSVKRRLECSVGSCIVSLLLGLSARRNSNTGRLTAKMEAKIQFEYPWLETVMYKECVTCKF